MLYSEIASEIRLGASAYWNLAQYGVPIGRPKSHRFGSPIPHDTTSEFFDFSFFKTIFVCILPCWNRISCRVASEHEKLL